MYWVLSHGNYLYTKHGEKHYWKLRQLGNYEKKSTFCTDDTVHVICSCRYWNCSWWFFTPSFWGMTSLFMHSDILCNWRLQIIEKHALIASNYVLRIIVLSAKNEWRKATSKHFGMVFIWKKEKMKTSKFLDTESTN